VPAVADVERKGFHFFAHALRNQGRVGLIRKAIDDQKLIAAPPHQQIRIPKNLFEHLMQLHQHHISGRMMIGVVNRFEIIQIHNQKHDVRIRRTGFGGIGFVDEIIPMHFRNRVLNEFGGIPPIFHAGQRVGRTEFRQGSIRLFEIGNRLLQFQ